MPCASPPLWSGIVFLICHVNPQSRFGGLDSSSVAFHLFDLKHRDRELNHALPAVTLKWTVSLIRLHLATDGGPTMNNGIKKSIFVILGCHFVGSNQQSDTVSADVTHRLSTVQGAAAVYRSQ